MVSRLALAQEESLDWPCEQREVAQISLGQNWPFPYDAASVREELANDAEVNALVGLLSLRRTDMELAQTRIDEFAQAHPDVSQNDYGWIYDQILANYNAQRSKLIAGIKRYADGQQSRSAKIDEMSKEFAEASRAENPDFDKLDEMEAAIDWETRIYNDREDALSYVCESPVLIEKQAYAIAQVLVGVAGE